MIKKLFYITDGLLHKKFIQTLCTEICYDMKSKKIELSHFTLSDSSV